MTGPDRSAVRQALSAGGLIDITTHGRQSGQDRRIEIAFFDFDGHIYISGMPGRRGWYANLLDEPRFMFHLKRGTVADLPASARPITDDAERRAILTRVTAAWNRTPQLEAFVARSPLIEVTFDDPTLLAG